MARLGGGIKGAVAAWGKLAQTVATATTDSQPAVEPGAEPIGA